MSTTSEATVMPHMPPKRLLLFPLLPLLLRLREENTTDNAADDTDDDTEKNSCQKHNPNPFLSFSAAKIQNFPQTAKGKSLKNGRGKPK